MENYSTSTSEHQETYDMCPKTKTARNASPNVREREAVSYLKRKGIYDIVDFLLGELLVRRPYDPYEYMTQLLDRRILARDGLVDSSPPFCSRDIIKQARQAELPTAMELSDEGQTRKFLMKKRYL
ncbi:uncharacterized protein LOC105198733 [Solenopsis invicta]|uniref:uncharacterized protein LOC105198733 n=1 Tax=Solenopsis invicta TaxID=13686 RepID=UPI00193D191C|nr:uncharacterized protein LOC105198733 [Solenopsis invicta]